MLPAVFLDRDDTLIHNAGDLGDPDEVRLMPGVPEGLRALRRAGFRLIVVTNQGGVARGRYSEEDVDLVHRRIAELVDELGGEADVLDRFYYCPYHPDATVAAYRRDHFWRKPRPGMLLQAARDLDLDLGSSWLIGDRARDVEAGRTAGCRTVLLSNGGDSPDECRPSAVADDFASAVRHVLKHADPRPVGAPVASSAATPTRPAIAISSEDDSAADVGSVAVAVPAISEAKVEPNGATAPARDPRPVRPRTNRSSDGSAPAAAPETSPRPSRPSRQRRRATPDKPASPPEAASPVASVSAVSDQTAAELRSAIGELVEEVRAERMRRAEFGGLRLAAGLLQLLAVLFGLLGVLQTGADDAFFRWLAGAGLVQLMVIALLVADSRS